MVDFYHRCFWYEIFKFTTRSSPTPLPADDLYRRHILSGCYLPDSDPIAAKTAEAIVPATATHSSTVLTVESLSMKPPILKFITRLSPTLLSADSLYGRYCSPTGCPQHAVALAPFWSRCRLPSSRPSKQLFQQLPHYQVLFPKMNLS